MREFKSSYSKGMLLSTSLVLILLLGAIYFTGSLMIDAPMGSSRFIVNGLILCVCVLALLYAFLVQIDRVCLTEHEVIVQKKWGRIVIPRDEIVQVESLQSLLSDIRLCGIGGLFGHMGLFWNQRLGVYHACVNNGNRMLVIKTTRKTYVVSCDERDELLALLQKPA